MKNYFVKVMERGFSNEFEILAFKSKELAISTMNDMKNSKLTLSDMCNFKYEFLTVKEIKSNYFNYTMQKMSVEFPQERSAVVKASSFNLYYTFANQDELARSDSRKNQK